jgi:hypothetical protein
MMRARHPVGATLIVVALAVTACGGSSGGEGGGDPATVRPIKGTDLNQVTLTAQAARRLGIETAEVRQRGARTSVPYGAVVYNADGSTFTYTSPKPRVYVRAPITVVRITGAEAILSHGPPAGTAVVTVGSQELYGSEYEVEED